MGKRRYKVDKKVGRKIQWVANTLVNLFHSQGIKVMRYDAFSTNSVYLKLDYGLLYSVRLSDHAGKQHLTYRFNATDKYQGPSRVATKWNWSREFYSLDTAQLNQMCRSILELRATLKTKFGAYGYQNRMDYKHRNHANVKGFWQSAQDLG